MSLSVISKKRARDDDQVTLPVASRFFDSVLSQAFALVHLRPLLDDQSSMALIHTESAAIQYFRRRPLLLRHYVPFDALLAVAASSASPLTFENIVYPTWHRHWTVPGHVKRLRIDVFSPTRLDVVSFPETLSEVHIRFATDPASVHTAFTVLTSCWQHLTLVTVDMANTFLGVVGLLVDHLIRHMQPSLSVCVDSHSSETISTYTFVKGCNYQQVRCIGQRYEYGRENRRLHGVLATVPGRKVLTLYRTSLDFLHIELVCYADTSALPFAFDFSPSLQAHSRYDSSCRLGETIRRVGRVTDARLIDGKMRPRTSPV